MDRHHDFPNRFLWIEAAHGLIHGGFLASGTVAAIRRIGVIVQDGENYHIYQLDMTDFFPPFRHARHLADGWPENGESPAIQGFYEDEWLPSRPFRRRRWNDGRIMAVVEGKMNSYWMDSQPTENRHAVMAGKWRKPCPIGL